MQYKTAAIRALIYRAYKLSSSIENFNKSYETITSIFVSNGFHFKFINKIKQQVISKINNPKPKEQDEKAVLYYKVPFIKDLEAENDKKKQGEEDGKNFEPKGEDKTSKNGGGKEFGESGKDKGDGKDTTELLPGDAG